MIDGVQLLLGLVIVVLTVTISLIAFQVYLILREFRSTLKKANLVLDDTEMISKAAVSKQEKVQKLGKKVRLIGEKMESIKISPKRRFFKGTKSL